MPNNNDVRDAIAQVLAGGGDTFEKYYDMPPDTQLDKYQRWQGVPMESLPAGTPMMSPGRMTVSEQAMPPARGAHSPPLPPWVGQYAAPSYSAKRSNR